MGYELGVDLGTTYTAAAVHVDGRLEIVPLGNRAPSIPSVVLLNDDESILAGEAAQRRALTEPERVAREFKRRVGDPAPLVLGGSPYSAEAITARLLRWVIDRVVELQGRPPDRVAITHPANWGTYKQDLLRQAIRLADLPSADLVSEPEAAAAHYASQERIDVGATVAVYDLGGGTFDAAVLRKTDRGWTILGEPEGIERLGGIDFDEAVFQHVRRAVSTELAALDPSDPATLAAIGRLRQECVDAKEVLSTDTDVGIPVLLPNVQTDVRLTRAELEGMIRPTLQDTIAALHRALRSAGVGPEDLDAVLLVGGSSRIPLVAQLVSAELGRPVAVDAHPKHAVALGAALLAGDSAAPPPSTAPAPERQPAAVVERADQTPARTPAPPAATPSPPNRAPLVVAGIIVLVVGALLAALLLGGGDDDEPEEAAEAAEAADESGLATTSTPSSPETSVPTIPAGPFVRLTDLRVDRQRYVLEFETSGFSPSVPDPASRHVHFFWNDIDPANAGSNGPDPGAWLLWDAPSVVDDAFFAAANRPSGATAICALVATHDHAVADVDGDGEPDVDTGDCLPLPEA